MNPHIYLLSSIGLLTVDAVTGLVIPSLSDYEDEMVSQGEGMPETLETLRNIERIDLEEWAVFWGEEPFVEESRFDILDFGFWNKDGTYEPPELDWRFELTAALTMDMLPAIPMPEIGTESTPHDMLRAFNAACEAAYPR